MIVVVLEIEERKQFLDQMTALGKKREYQQVISNEIADVRRLKTRFEILTYLFFLENTGNGTNRSTTFESFGKTFK
jgi:hypothetical protein